MKRIYNSLIYISALCFLLGLSIMFALRQKVILYALVAAFLLLFIKVIPVCRKRENVHMFFLVTVCSVPINIATVAKYIPLYNIWYLTILLYAFAYLVMLSLEQITMGYITRIIWPVQYRLTYIEGKSR